MTARAVRHAAARRRGRARGRGRPRGSGTRSKEALSSSRTRPGITIAEMADAMGIKANYLYRVMPTLEQRVRSSSGTGLAPGLDQSKLVHGAALILELLHRDVDLALGEHRPRGPAGSSRSRRSPAPGSWR